MIMMWQVPKRSIKSQGFGYRKAIFWLTSVKPKYSWPLAFISFLLGTISLAILILMSPVGLFFFKQRNKLFFMIQLPFQNGLNPSTTLIICENFPRILRFYLTLTPYPTIMMSLKKNDNNEFEFKLDLLER